MSKYEMKHKENVIFREEANKGSLDRAKGSFGLYKKPPWDHMHHTLQTTAKKIQYQYACLLPLPLFTKKCGFFLLWIDIHL